MKKLKLAYIIDDDEIIIYLTDKLLKMVDFADTVDKFTDAETALESLKQAIKNEEQLPEVILFDLNMPGMNGWEFIDEFKKLKTKIPTFIFTSSIDPADKQKAVKYREIKDFITKPLTVAKIDKLLRHISK